MIMPFRDGTGPLGEGPKTGRGLGSCNSKKKPSFNERPRLGLRRNLQEDSENFDGNSRRLRRRRRFRRGPDVIE